MILEAIGFQATAAAVAGSAGTVFTGDSLTVKNGVVGKKILLVAWAANHQTDGFSQIIAPSYSDTTRGLRVTTDGAQNDLWLPFPLGMPQFPQELLATTIAATAVAGDIEQDIIWLWYEDVPGLSGRYIDAAMLKQKFVRLNQVTNQLAFPATGNWGTAETLVAESDLLRANTDYALLGAIVQDRCAAVAMRAPDWSNVRAAIPGFPGLSHFTGNWFVRLSDAFGIPMIPVFNSANRGAINLDGAQDENAIAVDVTWVLAELVTPAL